MCSSKFKSQFYSYRLYLINIKFRINTIPKKKKEKSKIIFHYISDLQFTFFRRSMEETRFSCSLPYKTLLYTRTRNSDQLGSAWTDRFFSISACIDTLSRPRFPFFFPPSLFHSLSSAKSLGGTIPLSNLC